ncbi:MAG: hypothetical protein M1834_004208 [Cirrosporium novae-zelandiae]|nr:MAG: hypothetical protein M1834_004208 [Cirrosporium novae-zelandiae]
MARPAQKARNSTTQTTKKPATKVSVKTALKKSSTSASLTRKMSSKPTPEPTTAPRKKRGRPAETNSSVKPSKRLKSDLAINTVPSQKLDVYVFGLGDCGELGLGPTARNGKKPRNVKRPRINDLLNAKTVGVVQIAVGGMHCVALTQDQKILTWGVNNTGTLGRDTTWEAPVQDIDANSDDEDDEGTLNPKESTPTAIPTEFFGKHAKTFVQVAATGSASFALTDDGSVYGWGTFRGNDGAIGFSTAGAVEAARKKDPELLLQRRPTPIPQLKKIKFFAGGGNHVQALDHKGNVFAWGSGEQCQLGRHVMDRTRAQALTPCQFGLPKNKITSVSCGVFHSFAIDIDGHVYAWGLNNFGQTGIAHGAGESGALIEKPTIVKELEPYKIKSIEGGTHHSIACTEDGRLLLWDRCDDSQAGVLLNNLPQEDLIFDSRNKPRILLKPTIIPGILADSIAAGIDDSFAITKDGEAYSWGFSANYRTGLGSEDSVNEATLIANTAVKGKRLTFAGCGGQFSVLAGPATSTPTNGV